MIRNRSAFVGLAAVLSVCLWHEARAQMSSVDTETTEPVPAIPAPSTQPPDPEHEPDTTLSRHRTTFEVLTERTIGATSRRVRFDWRRKSMQLGATGALPAELNNFESLRAGGFIRIPSAGMLLEASVCHVWVRGTTSTRRLALTPYRQPGRPGRYELDFSVAYPVAEGVVTAVPRLIPAAELVLNAYADLRYQVYPGAFAGLGIKDTLKAILAPSFSRSELANLEDDRLPGMEVDPARYGLLVGLGTDVYFQSGFFFSHKLLVAVPLLQPMTETELGLGLDLTVSTGLAF